MKAINLGCGLVVAPGWINIDNSPNARLSKYPALRWALWKVGALSEGHYNIKWPASIEIHDLTRKLPYPDHHIDYVYTSHFIEHLERSEAEQLLREVFRVLKPCGIVRIVVPDLAIGVRQYVEAIGSNPEDADAAPRFLSWLQLGTSRTRSPHRWMYDAPSLKRILKAVGFDDIAACEYRQGRVPDCEILDSRPEDSLHIEAAKPEQRTPIGGPSAS